MRALDEDLPPPQSARLVSMRVSLHKIGLVSRGLSAGLSFGRERPTVQVGAPVMVAARRWPSPQPGTDAHRLMAAGAAFNTPPAGRGFVLEQLTRRRHITHRLLMIAAIVQPGFIALAVFDSKTRCGRLRVQAMSWSLPLSGLLVGRGAWPGACTWLRFSAIWPSAWAAVPAGFIAQSPAIGAGIGHDVAHFMGMDKEAAIPLIAMGMTAFLAATTGGPVTAFIFVMEMVSGQAMVLSLMACALLSSGVARLVTRSMYQELAMMLPLPPPHEPQQEKT